MNFAVYSPTEYAGLCLAAFFAGVVNSLAGGGTLLTFPALVAALLPHFGDEAGVFANGTSTVALAPASFSGAWAFRREIPAVKHWLRWLLIPSFLGGLLGSVLVTMLDEKYFNCLVPWLILLAASLFAAQPLLARFRAAPKLDAKPTAATLAGVITFQFFIGLYGGYFGAGIGILMLSSLALMGLSDIHEMNALKTILAGCINGVAVVVFIASANVVWPLALTMMATATLGGYLGARYGRKVKQKYIRWFVIAVGFTLAAWFFWKQFSA